LFTTGFSPEVQQNYILLLVSLVRSGRVFILATLRSDFYPSYQEFPNLIAEFRQRLIIRQGEPLHVRDCIVLR